MYNLLHFEDVLPYFISTRPNFHSLSFGYLSQPAYIIRGVTFNTEREAKDDRLEMNTLFEEIGASWNLEKFIFVPNLV